MPWEGRRAQTISRRAAQRKPNGCARARALVPCRLHPGPIDVDMALQADRPDLLPRLWALNEAFGPGAHDYEPVLQYWADGKRTVAEIGELAWLELDRPPDEHTSSHTSSCWPKPGARALDIRQSRSEVDGVNQVDLHTHTTASDGSLTPDPARSARRAGSA